MNRLNKLSKGRKSLIQDGDYGYVFCGICKKRIYRCEAGMYLKYLYLCGECESDYDGE